MKKLLVSLWVVLLISLTLASGEIEAQESVTDGNQDIYFVYPDVTDFSSVVVDNKVGLDGKGLHNIYENERSYTIPGTDVISDKKIVYSPATFCPSEGDAVFTYVDDVGNGGNGVILEHSQSKAVRLKVMVWHPEKPHEILEQKISSGQCVFAKDPLAYEGGSATIDGELTTFKKAGWPNPDHSHVSIGRNIPWNDGCYEVLMNGWYWKNITCESIAWSKGVQTQIVNPPEQIQSTDFNIDALVSYFSFKPQSGDRVQSDYSKNLVKGLWALGALTLLLLLYTVVKKLDS